MALSYNKEKDDSPKIVAKGKGVIAENIIKKAKESDVTIYEDDKLIKNLMKIDLNDEIPEELYEVVAEVILFVYSLDNKKGS